MLNPSLSIFLLTIQTNSDAGGISFSDYTYTFLLTSMGTHASGFYFSYTSNYGPAGLLALKSSPTSSVDVTSSVITAPTGRADEWFPTFHDQRLESSFCCTCVF